MAALICSDCERPAARSCVCCFPLPVLCEKHCLKHCTDSHFLLPADAFQQVEDNETQEELKEIATDLRRQVSLIKLYSDLQQQTTLDTREVLMQLYQDVKKLQAKVKGFKAEDALFAEVRSEWSLEDSVDILNTLCRSEKHQESEIGTWVDIAHGLTLKSEFQYEESCRVLEDRWKLVPSNHGVEVLVLGLVLSEVMGLHIGRFQEALAVLEKSLQVADELCPRSEVALQLANMKAATLIHILNFQECIDFCTKTVFTFRDGSTSEVSFGTTLYFYMTAFLSKESTSDLVIETLMKEWVAKTENISNSLIQHIRLYLSALLEIVKKDYKAAKDLIKEAGRLARQDFPISIYAGLCSFENYIMADLTGEQNSTDDECLRTHFPASLLHAIILETKANQYGRMRETAKEVEVRVSMHRLLQANPNCEQFNANLDELERQCLSSCDNPAALDIQESAYRVLLQCSFASRTYFKFLDSLRDIYAKFGQPEKEIEMYAEVIRKLSDTDGTDWHFWSVLLALAHWKEDTQRETAREMSVEMYQLFREKFPDSKNYLGAVQILGYMYINLNQEEMAAEIFLEGIQTAQTYHKFEDYVNFTDSLINLQLYRSAKEKQLAILAETHHFLKANASYASLSYVPKIKQLFSDQPEKLLEILLEIYHALKSSPTSSVFKEYLDDLTDFYEKADLQEEMIEIRLEVHRLLPPHPASENYYDNLHTLDRYYRKRQRLDLALELVAEAYRLHPIEFPQNYWVVCLLCNLYYDIGNPVASIQLVQKTLSCMAIIDFHDKMKLTFLSDLYFRMARTGTALTLFISTKQYWCDDSYYMWIYEIFSSSFFDKSVVETYLEIVSLLKQTDQELVYKTILKSLNYTFGTPRKEDITIRKMILQHMLSRCRNLTTVTEVLLHQIGGLHMRASEKESAEACYFRTAGIQTEQTPTWWASYQLRNLYR